MEARLFDPANPPEWLDPEWWRDHEHCDHLGSPTGAHVSRLKAAAHRAQIAALLTGGYRITDLGAGDGALLSLLDPEFRAQSWGYDIIRADVEHARKVRGVEVHLSNVALELLHDGGGLHIAPVVVLTEVLEHMADPHGFLAALAKRHEVRYVVASSPFQETAEKYEWNHAWTWDTIGYEHMFRAAGFEALSFEPVDWSQVWTFERVTP